MSSRLEIALRRSLIGQPQKQRRTAKALGLKKIGQVVYKEDRPEIRGMAAKISHLVEIKSAKK